MAVTADQMVKDLAVMNEAVSRTSDLLDGGTKQQFQEASARYLETLANRIDLQRAQERGVEQLSRREVESLVGCQRRAADRAGPGGRGARDARSCLGAAPGRSRRRGRAPPRGEGTRGLPRRSASSGRSGRSLPARSRRRPVRRAKPRRRSRPRASWPTIPPSRYRSASYRRTLSASCGPSRSGCFARSRPSAARRRRIKGQRLT